jgi:hypothetical protein
METILELDDNFFSNTEEDDQESIYEDADDELEILESIDD